MTGKGFPIAVANHRFSIETLHLLEAETWSA
jgi:hypothetical protein